MLFSSLLYLDRWYNANQMSPQRRRWKLFSNPLSIRSKRIYTNRPVSTGRRLRSSRFRSFWQLSRRQKGHLLLRWLGLGIIGVVVFMLLLFAVYAKDLPNPTTIADRQIAQSTKILDRNGIMLYEIFRDERRTVIKPEEISQFLKDATVSVEDGEFYTHHGVDLISILRAAYVNTVGHSRFTQGGSTITQQYIKNALLTDEKKISRKIKEAILALEIETIYDKQEILAGYLNEIPYGNNAYGVESAARTYFNKSAIDLNLSESATLAAIPQRPSYFSPYGSHLDELFIRKDYVLDEMVRRGFITDKQAAEAKATAPTLQEPSFAARSDSIKAPHFVFYVRDQLIKELGDDQEAEQKLASGGYTITTSLDYEIQKMAETAVANNFTKASNYGATNAGLVVVDPNTGDILAMVGSLDYFNDKFGSVNVTTSARQPGSSFKPIVYSTGFKGSFSPASVLFDLPTDFGNYKPNNYDGGFRGPVTVRQAISWSLNIPAVKMLDLVGIDEALKTAQDLGITTLTDRSRYGLSLVLGAGEVKLVEMVHAYSVFAHGGLKMPLTSILKMVDKDKKTMIDITDKERKGDQVLDPQVAWLMADVMSDNATKAPVFGNSLVVPGHTVGVKTGTTQSFKDAWTIGYTPQIAAGVWVGNNDGTEMKRGADGSVVAAPIWRAFMNAFLADKENAQFARPNGIVSETVSKLSTKLPNSNCSGELIADWFASWNKPTEPDSVDKIVRLDKITGKLATDKTPADQIEERCYHQLHSERPNRPNWEAPVLAWATANGYNADSIPTESDDIHTDANKPKVTIKTPVPNQGVGRSDVAVSSSVTATHPIATVTYFVGSEQKAETKSDPYSAVLNDLPLGEQTIRAVAKDQYGNSGEASVLVIVTDGAGYPGTVSSVNTSVSGKDVTISWTNPKDSDLASIKIYESTASGELGALVRTTVATPGTNSSTSFPSHSTGTYYYTLRAVDKEGNENPTTAQYVASVM